MRALPNQEDQDLRKLYQNLHEEDRQRVPDFQVMMARVREELSVSGQEVLKERKRLLRFPRKVAWGGILLAAAAAVFILLLDPGGTSDSEFVQVVQTFSADPAAGAWKSPTDGLLDLPGSEILSTVPSIGGSLWLSDPGAAPRRNEL
jgi:hypothetical protein